MNNPHYPSGVHLWNLIPRPGRRVLLTVGGVVIAVIAASLWWLSGADERRVNTACGTWLQHRESLRTVLTESDEAVGRAEAAHAASAGEYFNGVDTSLAAIQRWEHVSPRVRDSLDRSDGASELERGAASSFFFAQSGITELHELIEHGDPDRLASWVPEVSARFQNVDDVCLVAARTR